MKKIILIVSILLSMSISAQTAKEIIEKVDLNMSAENQVVESSMTIHGKRNSRTMTSRSYTVGNKQSFTEYLSPAREQGTKMLKLENKLWIYSPSTDRTILISGHMLRQSVMGSDMSYEDMMDDRKLTDIYESKIIGQEELDGRPSFKIEMIAIVDDVAYYKRMIWVDAERFVPLKEELYAKSGSLLKQTSLKDIKKIDGRWYPTSMVYKDMMKQGKGTEFKVLSIKFNQDIPDYVFTKAALKQ